MSMIQALEAFVVDRHAIPYFRLFAWRLLVQNWATLFFSDHRGMNPAEIKESLVFRACWHTF